MRYGVVYKARRVALAICENIVMSTVPVAFALEKWRLSKAAAKVKLEWSNAKEEAKAHFKLEVVNYRESVDGYDSGVLLDGSCSYDLCLSFSVDNYPRYKYMCRLGVVVKVGEVHYDNGVVCMAVSVEIGIYRFEPMLYYLHHFENEAEMRSTAAGDVISALCYMNSFFQDCGEDEWLSRVSLAINMPKCRLRRPFFVNREAH